MVSCGYSEFVGGICGPGSDNPANVQCVTISFYLPKNFIPSNRTRNIANISMTDSLG